MKKIDVFIERMRKVGVKIELVGNFPWIYLNKVNGKKVTEKFGAEHGFNVAYLNTKVKGNIDFVNIKETFKIIRKYK